MNNKKHSLLRIGLLGLVLLLISGPLPASTVTLQENKELAALPAITFLLTSGNIYLGSKGKLTFPEGSLPPGTKITVKEVLLPRLPDGLVPVGSAFQVEAFRQPTLPVEITMQVPPGEDADKLVLIRLESHGRITLLQTQVENGMLAAKTPGLSTIVEACIFQSIPAMDST